MAQRPSIGRDLLDVPMGDMIRDMAFAIADAQMKLDANSIEVAQMMGGLQTITETINGNEVVTFSDSRVFFGKEKMQLTTALDVYNATSDASLKASIKQSVIDPGVNTGEIEIANIIIVTGDPDTTTTTFTPNTKDDPKFFYKDNTVPATPEYYDFDSSRTVGSRYNKLTTPPNITYKLKSGKVDSSVYIPSRVSMLELGFAPTFYQFVDTIIEVKISIRFTEESESNVSVQTKTQTSGVSAKFNLGKGKVGVATQRQISTSQVNASYSQKFSYSAEGSSLLRTKLTPIPPPAILEERIRQQMEIAREGK
jgi:hypothetical protein